MVRFRNKLLEKHRPIILRWFGHRDSAKKGLLATDLPSDWKGWPFIWNAKLWEIGGRFLFWSYEEPWLSSWGDYWTSPRGQSTWGKGRSAHTPPWPFGPFLPRRPFTPCETRAQGLATSHSLYSPQVVYCWNREIRIFWQTHCGWFFPAVSILSSEMTHINLSILTY